MQRTAVPFLLLTCLTACHLLAGVDDFRLDQRTSAGAGGTGVGGTSSVTAAGGGGPTLCVPGAACYDGPAGTEGVGICHAGAMSCGADTAVVGSCEIQTTPQTEACDGSLDEDCDGVVDDGCQTCGSPDVPPAPTSCVVPAPGAEADCGPSMLDCCESKLIPCGEFKRSYDGVGFTDESHPAILSDFRIDTFEVTVGRFRSFVDGGYGVSTNGPAAGSGGHPKVPGSGWQSLWNLELRPDTAALETKLKCQSGYHTWTDDASGDETLAINCISWFEAFAFCVYDGGRLPTEAEWNYAAAGGDEQRVYPWSSPPNNTTVNSTYAIYGFIYGASEPVGSVSPMGDGPLGLVDLGGNMDEWVLDAEVDPYPTPCLDCAQVTGTQRIHRGGGFGSAATALAVSVRGALPPTSAFTGNGVRCARDVAN